MLEKIKSNLSYVGCVILGLFNFILLAIPYISSYYSYDLGEWGGKQSGSEGISGYEVMDLWDGGFSGVMSSLIQLFILIGGIVLLAWGLLGLLQAFGIFDKFPDRLGNIESKKLGEFGIFGLAGLNVLLLVFLIILSAVHTESYSEYGMKGSAGIRLSAGIFISLVLTVGAAVGLKVLEMKLPATGSGESVMYACSKCGKKAGSSDKFCNACGGEIEKKVVVKEEYACAKCGKRASAKDRFCSACGGVIEKRVVHQEECACVKCARKSSVKEKFCSACGGEIRMKGNPLAEDAQQALEE